MTIEERLSNWWRSHKIVLQVFAFLQGLIATIAGVAGLIPPKHLPYYLGASALFAYFRSFVTEQTQGASK